MAFGNPFLWEPHRKTLNVPSAECEEYTVLVEKERGMRPIFLKGIPFRKMEVPLWCDQAVHISTARESATAEAKQRRNAPIAEVLSKLFSLNRPLTVCCSFW